MRRQSRSICTRSCPRHRIRVLVIVLCVAVIGPECHLTIAPAHAEPGAKPPVQHNQNADEPSDGACRSCHADKVNSFHQTAHYLTSRMPDEQSILGSFAPGNNILKTANPNLFFRMEQRRSNGKNEFFQTAVVGTPPHTSERTEQFGIVVGSGGKGQTYLYWNDDLLFQLPVSQWRDLGWVNSPGYRDGFADFDRPIIPRCLECHATYIESQPPPSNRYSHAGFVPGIQCEKCHGPGGQHVRRVTTKSGASSGGDMLNPARFPRDRQMDLCAWCHAGHGDALLPSFAYKPGEVLAKYIGQPQPGPDAPLDVHGNQVEMLRVSRCFRESEMTCLTCHDVHSLQHDLTQFSQRCKSCHKPDSATFSKPGHPVSNNCIDCHMPRLQTNLIVFDWQGKSLRPQIRTHWIKVYAPAVQR